MKSNSSSSKFSKDAHPPRSARPPQYTADEQGLKRAITRLQQFERDHNRLPKSSDKELGSIVDFLWSENIHRVIPKQTKTNNEFAIFEYFFEEGGQGFTREKLSEIVLGTWNLASEVYGDWKLECLLSHIKAELPEVESRGFVDFVKANPYTLVAAIGTLVRRKTFKGTCPVCEDWQ